MLREKWHNKWLPLGGFEVLPLQHVPLRFYREVQGVSGPWPCSADVPSPVAGMASGCTVQGPYTLYHFQERC